MNNWPSSPNSVELYPRNIPPLIKTDSNQEFPRPEIPFSQTIHKVIVASNKMETNNFLHMLHKLGVSAEVCSKIHSRS